jgi:hypothetical protein
MSGEGDMLTDELSALWEDYLRAEGRAPRDQKLAALGTFLDALTAPPADWHPWARAIAERVVDDGDDFVIRMPLFERAVFPALLAGLRAELPGCARWLAGLAQHLHRSPACLEQLPPDQQTELGLLRAAVRTDPTDHLSRRRLTDIIAGRLRYSLHELPSGVLYGRDGATPDECLELEQELEDYCALVTATNDGTNYEELVRDCRYHITSYREFLLSGERGGGYAAYLARRVR